MNRPRSTDSHRLSSIGRVLPGNQSNWNQKMYSITYPSQNTGADTPKSANSIPARSRTDLGLVADMTPMGRPIRTHTTEAPAARTMVTGRESNTRSFTGTKLLYEKYTCSFRKNPGHGTRPLANRPYWTYQGLSSPRFSRACWMMSGLVRRPAAILAGSPGGG